MIDQSRALDAIDKREYVLSKMRCEYQKLISQTKRVILDIIPTMTTTTPLASFNDTFGVCVGVSQSGRLFRCVAVSSYSG